jgi:hypothetical protein
MYFKQITNYGFNPYENLIPLVVVDDFSMNEEENLKEQKRDKKVIVEVNLLSEPLNIDVAKNNNITKSFVYRGILAINEYEYTIL